MSESTTDPFAYDVAISFLSKDEPVAVSISDRLADRYKTFVFPKKQEILATDKWGQSKIFVRRKVHATKKLH